MPIWNSGKLFQVRSKTEKSKFIGKGYSSIGPAKRAITANHTRAVKQHESALLWLEKMENTPPEQINDYTNRQLEYTRNTVRNLTAWLDPHNFEIVEFAVVEKTVHEYTPPA